MMNPKDIAKLITEDPDVINESVTFLVPHSEDPTDVLVPNWAIIDIDTEGCLPGSHWITYAVDKDGNFTKPSPDAGQKSTASYEKRENGFIITDYHEDPEHELNVANANARAILDMLDIDDKGLSGTIDPNVVISKLASISPDQFTRETEIEQGVKIDQYGVGPGGTILNIGLSPEQIERYIEKLVKIAYKALSQGKEIEYG